MDTEARRLSEVVERNVSRYENSPNCRLVIHFGAVMQTDPISNDQLLEYFFSFEVLVSIFRRVNNKGSSGVDGVLSISQHLADFVVAFISIIF